MWQNPFITYQPFKTLLVWFLSMGLCLDGPSTRWKGLRSCEALLPFALKSTEPASVWKAAKALFATLPAGYGYQLRKQPRRSFVRRPDLGKQFERGWHRSSSDVFVYDKGAKRRTAFSRIGQENSLIRHRTGCLFKTVDIVLPVRLEGHTDGCKLRAAQGV